MIRVEIIFLLLFVFIPISHIAAQECDFVLSGNVIDESTELPLSFANIYIEENEVGVVTDESGTFSIAGLCLGDYHLRVSHVGCENERLFLSLQSDTILTIELHHHTELLDEVVVHGTQADNTAQTSNSVSQAKIDEQANKNLGKVLESIAGVSTLKNGSGIAKPVIQGLYGNRIAILNNGIAQSGQQWGNDHAPEIDPMTADHISVIKGAGVLAYNGTSLGALVLVEPGSIANEPHLHGKANYIFQSNGLGHTLNLQLEKYGKKFAWRTTGTLKLIGDRQTPDYYLTNTGTREGNFSIQIEKEITKKWRTSLYYSQFNTQLGVLRGSHIGNLTDLEQALIRQQPFFTQDTFSYNIAAPSQTVQHHLLKAQTKYQLTENQSLEFIYGGQLNRRKEFDVRRSGRSEIAALSLQQFSNFLEGNYKLIGRNNQTLKAGVQHNYVSNINVPGTGILPLIPNYESFQTSAFAVYTKEQNRLFFEAGLRYSYKLLEAWALADDLPRRFLKKTNDFHNLGASGGVKFQINDRLKTAFNLGYISRNPEINELYSRGLHQGVSGIEEGDENLQSEEAFKATWLWEGNLNNRLFFQVLAYVQEINNFIYLQPQPDFRLTIRGAFPLFLYKQTNARLSGFDLTSYFQASENLRFTFKYAYLYGQNLTDEVPLVFMPPNNLTAAIKYNLAHLGSLDNCAFELTANYVAEQKNILPEQDLALAPEAYFLLGAQFSAQQEWNKTTLKFFLRGENILNTTYRDYLNRLRYFADEPGINLVAGLNWKF